MPTLPDPLADVLLPAFPTFVIPAIPRPYPTLISSHLACLTLLLPPVLDGLTPLPRTDDQLLG
jgi:hypothetical protein